MARKLRVEYEGAIYHVMIRGVERRRLFDDDADRERLVGRMSSYAESYGVRLYLYCLMSNHVHLLLETPGANLGPFMHRLQTAYTVYYNKRHGRIGHLFQGRYKAILVEGDEYLLKLSRYIHLNPVMVGAVKTRAVEERAKALRRYVWSSYRAYLGKTPALVGLDVKPLLAMMGSGRGAAKEYRRYVESGLVERDEEMETLKKESPWGIGSAAFLEGIQKRYEKRVRECGSPEDAALRRRRALVESSRIIDCVGKELGLEAGWERRQRHDLARPILASMLCRYGGLSQREVAPVLGMATGAAVSLQLKRVESARAGSREIARQVERIDNAIALLLKRVSPNI